MNNTKSHGPDNFSCFLIKKIDSSLALPLSLLFQCSLNEGKLPDIWKTACIVPLYKVKAARNKIVNYRPLSLTSVVREIIESVIKIEFMKLCIDNNLIFNIQHRFKRGKFTITNLLELSNDLTKERGNGNSVDIICIDFVKAFDIVPQNQLIYKLSRYGI